MASGGLRAATHVATLVRRLPNLGLGGNPVFTPTKNGGLWPPLLAFN
jgi:hypothetical protein